MKTKLDTVATAAICKSSWMTCCKVPKCDIIALQEMYDTARKIENNLVMYWCLSRNDKKVTDFRKEMQCVQDVGLSLVRVSFATGVYGCSRECGATDLCWREGGGGGVRPFLFSTENSHIVAHSLTVQNPRILELRNWPVATSRDRAKPLSPGVQPKWITVAQIL